MTETATPASTTPASPASTPATLSTSPANGTAKPPAKAPTKDPRADLLDFSVDLRRELSKVPAGERGSAARTLAAVFTDPALRAALVKLDAGAAKGKPVDAARWAEALANVTASIGL